MSQLYIRVRTGFYTNRKTVKLRSKIGADANWIPPRLWAYAAENQPDGNLSSYKSEEIAELVGCPKYATSILQALKDCGFVDKDGMIHDWAEHNGYHERFSIRAKTAAQARWSKAPPTPPEDTETGKGKGDSGDKHCYKDATSIPVELPAGFPKTEDEARATASFVGCTEQFAGETWNKAMARCGHDAKDVPIRSWQHYLRSEMTFDKNRTERDKGRPAFRNGKPQLKPDHEKGF